MQLFQHKWGISKGMEKRPVTEIQELFIQALLLGKCMCNHRKIQFVLFIYELEFWKWSGYKPHIAHLFFHQYITNTYFTDSNSTLRQTTPWALLTNWRRNKLTWRSYTFVYTNSCTRKSIAMPHISYRLNISWLHKKEALWKHIQYSQCWYVL